MEPEAMELQAIHGLQARALAVVVLPLLPTAELEVLVSMVRQVEVEGQLLVLSHLAQAVTAVSVLLLLSPIISNV